MEFACRQSCRQSIWTVDSQLWNIKYLSLYKSLSADSYQDCRQLYWAVESQRQKHSIFLKCLWNKFCTDSLCKCVWFLSINSTPNLKQSKILHRATLASSLHQWGLLQNSYFDHPGLGPFLKSTWLFHNLPLEEEWTTIFSFEPYKLIYTKTWLVLITSCDL